MNNRERADLDNYITGHYGEDQFNGDEPEQTERVGHTPGPWRISSECKTIIKQDLSHIGLGDSSGVLIGSASGYTGSGFFPTDEEAVCNARLIAAAPELLEALKELAEVTSATAPHDGVPQWLRDQRIKAIDEAFKVIAKAEGGS